MKMNFSVPNVAILWVAFAFGCGQMGTPSAQVDKAKPTSKNEQTTSAEKKESGHDHSGWWCNEHGVPEEVCALCSSKVAAEFQKKGDWCKEHDRPDSQCFKCHPEYEAKFAAQYEAKFGKKPPTPEG